MAKTIIAIQHWDVSAIDRTLTVVDYVINIFVIIWTFVIIKNIAVSIAEEYNSRGIPVESKPTYNIGIAMCITQAMGILFLRLPYMRLLGGLATSVNFILWIIYWVKINNYKKSLRASSLSNEEGSIFQDLY